MSIKILYVENDEVFLETWRAYLRREGWKVEAALSFQEAIRKLRAQHFDLILLDQRLENNDDEYDRLGLKLAEMQEFGPLPKIIVTAYPSWEDGRSMFRTGHAAAPVDYLKKQEGPEEMIRAIRKILNDCAFNFHLGIEYGDLPLSGLAEMLADPAPSLALDCRMDSMDALLRRLFPQAKRLRIERKLWRRDGLTAVLVYEGSDAGESEPRVVICGPREAIARETQQHQTAKPKTPRRSSTIKLEKHETVHFAASAYALVDADGGQIINLKEAYSQNSEPQFASVLQSLFNETLRDWQAGRFKHDEERTLDAIYRSLTLPEPDRESPQRLIQKLKVLLGQIPSGRFTVTRAQGKYQFRLNPLPASLPCTDPFELIYQPLPAGSPVQLIHSPVRLTGDNILTDNALTWLTDFAGAGYVPVHWNFLEVEAAIRFDWFAVQDLGKRHELEQRLAENDFSLPTSQLDNPLRKPIKAIQVIRQLAQQESDDWRLYHFGMLFQAMRRLAVHVPNQERSAEEIARLTHLLIAAGKICHHLSTGDGTPKLRLWMDERGAFYVYDHRLENLTVQNRDLLGYLYQHRRRTCTVRELGEDVLNQRNVPNNTVVKAIARLQERLEALDADKAWIVVEKDPASGKEGYKLNL